MVDVELTTELTESMLMLYDTPPFPLLVAAVDEDYAAAACDKRVAPATICGSCADEDVVG